MNNDQTPQPMPDQPNLDARLAGLRAALADVDTPRCVEKELMQAFAARFPRKRPWYRRLGLPEWSAAAAGAVLSLAMLALLLVPPRLVGDSTVPHSPRLDEEGAFVALDSFERIEHDPAPRLVEAEVPRTMLAALGLPTDPENAGDAVRAEILLGAAGEPLALRLTDIH